MLMKLIRWRLGKAIASALATLAISALWTAWPAAAGGRGGATSLVNQVLSAVESRNTHEVPAAGRLEVAFSPNAGAEALVVKTIDSAQQSVRVMAYSFTSAPVVQALLRAQKRGAKVQAVVDHKSNIVEDKSGKARAALSTLSNAGVDVRTIEVYSIAHDKVIVVDGRTVELGSFNYSAAAQTRNSENVLVNWDNPALAKVYEAHFERNWAQGRTFSPRY